MLFLSVASLTIKNVNFENCKTSALPDASACCGCVNCVLSYYGGAIAMLSRGSLSIANSRFENSTAYGGGAVHLWDGKSLSISSSVFQWNTAPGSSGGAVYVTGTVDTTIADSYFIGNSATTAGAVQFSEGTSSISNSIFNSNVATSSSGGAIQTDQKTALTITHSTFSSNSVRLGSYTFRIMLFL